MQKKLKKESFERKKICLHKLIILYNINSGGILCGIGNIEVSVVAYEEGEGKERLVAINFFCNLMVIYKNG